jgi:hypothetical protein
MEIFLVVVYKSLQRLQSDRHAELLGFRNKSILAGDLNAKHPVINSAVSNPSGLNLLELFVSSYFEIPAFGGWRGISSFHLCISRL